MCWVQQSDLKYCCSCRSFLAVLGGCYGDLVGLLGLLLARVAGGWLCHFSQTTLNSIALKSYLQQRNSNCCPDLAEEDVMTEGDHIQSLNKAKGFN